MAARVLILTAGYGEGHNSAARNLAVALNARPDVVARTADPLEALGDTYADSRRRYVAFVDRAPELWRLAYHALDLAPLERLAAGRLRPAENALGNMLAEFRPDAVAATHPLYPILLARLSRRGFPIPPVALVVTDSISVNRVWSRVPATLRLCADRFSAGILARRGADAVRATGFPVAPEFEQEAPHREPPGAGRTARALLVAGTAAKDVEATAEAVASIPGVTLTVTTGHDTALAERLRGLARTRSLPITVLGRRDDMPALLRSHHIALGKAGGATTHETFAARTPFVITRVLPGQEEGNARLVLRLGTGEVAASPAAAGEAVRRMIEHDGALWRMREERLRRLTRRDGAARTAGAVLSLVA